MLIQRLRLILTIDCGLQWKDSLRLHLVTGMAVTVTGMAVTATGSRRSRSRSRSRTRKEKEIHKGGRGGRKETHACCCKHKQRKGRKGEQNKTNKKTIYIYKIKTNSNKIQ